MKPLQIGLLVVAGALGGAVVMKVSQRSHVSAAPPRVVAQVQQPAPAPAPLPPAVEPPPSPASASDTVPAAISAAAAEEPKPKPFAVKKTAPPVVHPKVVETRRPVIHVAAPPPKPAPAPAPVVAKVETPPPAAAAPPPPVRETLPPPPVRTEPEHVTPAPPPPPPAPEPARVTLNAGMLLPVRLVDGLSTERNRAGDTFTATLDHELVVDGFVIAERGARVEGRVAFADQGGKVKGTSALAVELTRLHTSDGQNIAIQTDSFERRAEPSHTDDAKKVGAGAAVGAIIGAIAGGGKGAAIGAGVGGGAGAGDVLLTRGKPVALPSETRINFRLRSPITITEKKG